MKIIQNKIESLAPNALELFKLYVKDAGNWSGTPMVGHNVGLLGDKEDRGLITRLKRAGLITTQSDQGDTFIIFTAAGKEFAVTLGLAEWIACATPKPQEWLVN